MDDAQPQARLTSDGPTEHEANKLRVRGLAGFAVALVAGILLVQVLIALLMNGFKSEEKTMEAQAFPRFAGDTGEYPSPRIQSDPSAELTRLRANDLGQLNTYGWVDQKNGVAHIPVDRAIEILAKSGLPRVSAPAPATEASPEKKPTEPQLKEQLKRDGPRESNP